MRPVIGSLYLLYARTRPREMHSFTDHSPATLVTQHVDWVLAETLTVAVDARHRREAFTQVPRSTLSQGATS